MTISKSKATVCTDEFWRQLGRQSSWWFLSRQRLSFHLRFRSQQGFCALTNPRISLRSTVVDVFWVSSYSAFGDDFGVNRDRVRGRIQPSAGEAVSLTVYESAATQFSLAISDSTGTLCADESLHQLWKKSRWWCLSRQLLSFRLWFQSLQKICAPTNTGVNSVGSLVDYFWVGYYSSFCDDFRVNRDFVRWWIQASAMEAVSVFACDFGVNRGSVR
jgi:hypothetical protein